MFSNISINVARALIIVIVGSLFAGMSRLMQQEGGMVYAIVGVVLVVVAAVISVAISTRGAKDDTVMPVAQRWLLLGYLLSIGACLVYLIVVLGSADFPEATAIVGPSSPVQQTAAADAPLLKIVLPESMSGSSSDLSLMLYGQNFHDGAIVKVNSRDRAAKTVEKGTLLSVPLQQSDLASVNSLAVAVVNQDDNKVSNAAILSVTKPRVNFSILSFQTSITRELQLLLLIVFAGALGSYVHAIRSLTDFIGNRTVVASWFWWYIARPFEGMSMALVFYAVLRGGFLAGTPADAKYVNPFGVVAIGALVGMFADKAAQKLAELFDTLFRAEDTRKDRLVSPTVDKITPDSVRPGTVPVPEISVSGAHLSGIDKVRVNQQDRAPKSVDDKQVRIALTATDIAQPSEITIALLDKAGTVISAGTLFVTDLDIKAPVGTPSAGTLPPGTHGQAYTPLTLTAMGGVGPYRWEMLDPVFGLVIDNVSGVISGTPKSGGDFATTIKLTDSKKVSVLKTFKLKID